MKSLAVYIHWPFCVSKCPYCDFASRPLPGGEDEGLWAESYAREIAHYARRLANRTVGSVYFGGGTPSLMAPRTVGAVIEKIAALWSLAPDCEITLEANPSSSEVEKFKAFRAAGVNRLSLGVQSFDDAALRFLGRAHDAQTARRAIEAAASVFARFSFDLIYARAGQTCAQWEKELREALAFAPTHLSLYQLTIEKGSVFYKRAKDETLTASDEEAASMFEATQALTQAAGLPAYEISNHAQKGQESRHNMTYWRYGDYIGIGPAAHGRFVGEDEKRRATENHTSPALWLEQCAKEGHGCAHEEILDEAMAMREAALMGLRLANGIDAARWDATFSRPLAQFFDAKRVETLVREGLLHASSDKIAATEEGFSKVDALTLFLSAAPERKT